MPLDDFHGAGHPRPGQWVWCKVGKAERMLAIVHGRDHGMFRTRQHPAILGGDVEVIGMPKPEEVQENRAKLLAKDPAAKRGQRDHYVIDVLALGGRNTAFHVLVHGDRLTPVVSRSELPKEVLATAHPDWHPRP